ncbi:MULTISPECIES: M42 family metallopeptidase [unclassified Ruminococcus]|uniref:M42 family metallopeptidase n=1 Tax=unclassified Ruminococcus TaxID=2608920 RepID=UPI00210EC910|nr:MULTISPECIES: M42 family peptidase [unclassified Ruminococcus]MCQ4022045.1 M42 family peptidase [Ruminococcus sp. zg-924]MCQ4114365.1 M42 family peptidase [Ruminococcus sp. zg-921]
MLDLSFLKKLCLLSGISGDEKKVSELIQKRLRDSGAEINIDGMGNLLVTKKGRKRAKNKVLLSAHMDEVGFIVTDINSDGTLRLETVGGVDRKAVYGKNVIVGKNCINGVISVKPVHLLKPDEKDTVIPVDKMAVDIGAESREEAIKYVSLGDSVSFVPNYNDDNGIIMAKALDDRAGCYILTEILRQELEYDITCSFVVQEEIGLRGAKAAAYTIDPDFAIVVEATTASDIPGCDDTNNVCCVGNGAVLSFMDRSTIYDKECLQLALKTAQEKKINVQLKRAVAGGNDAGAIHTSRSGVRTMAVSLPCRYIHSQTGLISAYDLESSFNIVKEMAMKLAVI